MHELIEKITRLSSSLPRAERIIAEALLENPEAIERMTLAEISRESGTSEASIIRFCRRLGYNGYTAMKEAFTEANHMEPASLISIAPNDDMSVILNKLYKNNMEVLSETLEITENNYDEVLGVLLRAKSIHFLRWATRIWRLSFLISNLSG